MTRASRQFVDQLTGNFTRGYALGKDNRQQRGEEELAAFNVNDYSLPEEGAPQETGASIAPESLAIPDQAPPGPAAAAVPPAAPTPAFGEGGDPEAVNALIEADSNTGAIEEPDPQYGTPPMERAVKFQQSVPKVKIIDWEAAKAAKAKAYARAGMADKAANIDAEFADLKHRKFQEYGNRALQTLSSDPALAAKHLSMASQFTADGKQTHYLPTPGGQIMEIEVDEQTGKPIGKGTPIDEKALSKMVLMHADPAKFLYTQYDREYQGERDRQADEQWQKKFDQEEEKIGNAMKRWGGEMDLAYDEHDRKKYYDQARIANDSALNSGYTQIQIDKKREDMNDFITAQTDPTKFLNAFGPEYGYNMEEDPATKMPIGMPNIGELRSGAEGIMLADTANHKMSPQTAINLYLATKNPEGMEKLAAEGKLNVDGKTGRPIVKGPDNEWYFTGEPAKAAPGAPAMPQQ